MHPASVNLTELVDNQNRNLFVNYNSKHSTSSSTCPTGNWATLSATTTSEQNIQQQVSPQHWKVYSTPISVAGFTTEIFWTDLGRIRCCSLCRSSAQETNFSACHTPPQRVVRGNKRNHLVASNASPCQSQRYSFAV